MEPAITRCRTAGRNTKTQGQSDKSDADSVWLVKRTMVDRVLGKWGNWGCDGV